MNEIQLTNELKENLCEKNLSVLTTLMQRFELAKLGKEIADQHEKSIIDLVLAENEFFANEECEPIGVKKGDRILKEKYDFLLSENDFEKLHALARPIMVKENIIDENGYYTRNWVKETNDARNDLVSFIIMKIMPMEMRKVFWTNRKSIVYTDKLINIMKGLLK